MGIHPAKSQSGNALLWESDANQFSLLLLDREGMQVSDIRFKTLLRNPPTQKLNIANSLDQKFNLPIELFTAKYLLRPCFLAHNTVSVSQ